MTLPVLVVLADSSFGGTARSALEYARLWRAAGATVTIGAMQVDIGTVQSRMPDFEVVSTRDLGDAARPSLLHLHHAAPTPWLIEETGALLSQLDVSHTAILTHNVFGGQLPLAPFHRVEGVLGDWLGAQLRLSVGSRNLPPLRRMPNPQDFSFFRIPSERERVDARRRLQIAAEDRVVLRVGSPSPSKWHVGDYKKLVKHTHPDTRYRFVGAPNELIDQVKTPRVEFIPTISDDHRLRDEYWAADAFALSATRGESFGNVALEALGTGLPVTYRAREDRDNTPWEFRSLDGFRYARGTAAWIDQVTAGRRLRRSDPRLVETYASASLQQLLETLVQSLDRANDPLATLSKMELVLPRVRPIPIRGLLSVSIRHNRASAAIRSWRRSRMFSA